MPIPPSETIIERKICPISGEEFFVTDKDLEFYDAISPIFNGKKYGIPSPTLCPDERMRQVMCFLNQRNLYKIQSCVSGDTIISYYGPHSPRQVCSVGEWYGDGWNPKDYERDFIFDQPYCTQFQNFISEVPHWALSQGNTNENSEYTNHGQGNKSCYLLLTGSHNMQVYYATYVYYSTNCMDCEFCKECEMCYGCTDIQKSFGLQGCVNCSNCTDGYFLQGCTNCQYCFGCCNMIGKKFYLYNQEVGESAYRDFVETYHTSSEEKRAQIRNNALGIWEKSVQSSLHGYSNEQVVGDYIYNSSRVWKGFEIKNAQDIKNCVSLDTTLSTHDCIMSRNSEWNYYSSLVSNHSSNVAFSSSIVGEGHHIYYSDCCFGISNCFACCGFHNHEHHCILNKPYSVQEYEELAGKIIDHMRSTGEWGEFFPHELSPHGYNETVAMEYFPLTEDQVRAMPRFHEWRNGEKGKGKSEKGEGEISKKNTKDKIQNTKGDTEKEIEIDLKHASLGREVPFRAEGCDGNLETTGGITNSYRNPPGLWPSPLHRGATQTNPFSSTGGGWNWYSEPSKTFNGPSITTLPIEDYDEKKVGFETAQKNIDTLLNGIILCEVTKKPFKIIRQELAFYIENSIPIPTKHPDERHKERMALRNPRKLFERTCAECGKEIITTYASDRPEKVVCEECYRKLVY